MMGLHASRVHPSVPLWLAQPDVEQSIAMQLHLKMPLDLSLKNLPEFATNPQRLDLNFPKLLLSSKDQSFRILRYIGTE